MTPRIITADEAKALAAKWRGLSGPFRVEYYDAEECHVVDDEGTIVARVEDFDDDTGVIASLFAGAPDDVKALSSTVVTLCDAADASARRNADLRRDVELLTRERDALRAIIDGRTTPPTDEEIAAHCGAGGRWRSIGPGDFILSTGDGDAEDAQQTAAVQHANADIVTRAGVRWWAIDAQGRCSAWPVVAEASR